MSLSLRQTVRNVAFILVATAFAGFTCATAHAQASLAGRWTSNIGLTYDVVQEAEVFNWTIPGNPQLGQGTISNRDVSATYRLFNQRFNVSGRVTAMIDGGYGGSPIATQVNWNNGVVWTRDAGGQTGSSGNSPDGAYIGQGGGYGQQFEGNYGQAGYDEQQTGYPGPQLGSFSQQSGWCAQPSYGSSGRCPVTGPRGGFTAQYPAATTAGTPTGRSSPWSGSNRPNYQWRGGRR